MMIQRPGTILATSQICFVYLSAAENSLQQMHYFLLY